MERTTPGGAPMFRLWIATYTDWRPTHWNQVPPRAIALEPVEDALYSSDEAALFVEGFNRSVLSGDHMIWAVAVPITVRYEGDATAGMPIRGRAFGCEPSECAAGQPQPAAPPTRPTPVRTDGD